MKSIRKNTKLILILVLPVYLFIVQNSLLNKHTHFYANGMVVTHSHPFDHNDSNHGNDHQHSKKEICFFQNLQFDYFKHATEIQFDFKNDRLIAELSEVVLLPKYFQPLLQFISRGPPLRIS